MRDAPGSRERGRFYKLGGTGRGEGMTVRRKAFVEARLSPRGSKIRHPELKQFGLSFISDHFSNGVRGVGVVGSKKGWGLEGCGDQPLFLRLLFTSGEQSRLGERTERREKK